MRRRERGTAPDGLTGETKVCPYCAEVIRAAAIRCRYCQSDLTDAPAPGTTDHLVVEPATTTEPAPAVDPVGSSLREETSTGSTSTGTRTTGGPSQRVLLGAVAVAVVLTLVFGALAFRAWDRQRDLAAAEEAGRTVRATLPDKLADVLSYDFQTFDQNREKAVAALTPKFRKEYLPTLDEIEQRATQQRRSQDAVVVAVAVLRAARDRATTLVFINRTTTTAGSDRQRILLDRANVTMVRRDGTWLIDDISFPTS